MRRRPRRPLRPALPHARHRRRLLAQQGGVRDAREEAGEVEALRRKEWDQSAPGVRRCSGRVVSAPPGGAGRPDRQIATDPRCRLHTLDVDEKEAEIIRSEIFGKFLELGSSRAVVRHLGTHGITRPTRNGGKRGAFHIQGVIDILSNPFYTARRAGPDGELVDCVWPAIVDEDTFVRVQAKLGKNSVKRPTGKESSFVYLLEGVIRCSCGNAMIQASGKGRAKRYHYYKCSKKHRTGNVVCQTRDVPADLIEVRPRQPAEDRSRCRRHPPIRGIGQRFQGR